MRMKWEPKKLRRILVPDNKELSDVIGDIFELGKTCENLRLNLEFRKKVFDITTIIDTEPHLSKETLIKLLENMFK